MCAARRSTHGLGEKQRSDLDCQPKLFTNLARDRVCRIFASPNPAARESPRKIRPKHVLDEQYAAVAIEQRSDRTDGRPRREHAGDEAQAKSQHCRVSQQRGEPALAFRHIAGAPCFHNSDTRA